MGGHSVQRVVSPLHNGAAGAAMYMDVQKAGNEQAVAGVDVAGLRFHRAVDRRQLTDGAVQKCNGYVGALTARIRCASRQDSHLPPHDSLERTAARPFNSRIISPACPNVNPVSDSRLYFS